MRGNAVGSSSGGTRRRVTSSLYSGAGGGRGSSSGGGGRMILSHRALLVLAALCLSIFVMGLMIGTHVVMHDPSASSSSSSSSEGVDDKSDVAANDVNGVHDAAKRSLNDVALRAARVSHEQEKELRKKRHLEKKRNGDRRARRRREEGIGGRLRGEAGGLGHVEVEGEGIIPEEDDEEEETDRMPDEAFAKEEMARDASERARARGVPAITEEEEREMMDRLEAHEGEMEMLHPELREDVAEDEEREEEEGAEGARQEGWGAAQAGGAVAEGGGGTPKKKAAFPYLGDPVPPDHDFTSYVPLGPNRHVEYKDGGPSPYDLSPSLLVQSDDVARTRRRHVKNAMKHAWSGYRKYAFGKDEVLPQTKTSHDNWGGMGTTLVDSLDTLWLMGLRDEFDEARDWVRDRLDHSHVGIVSVFETTIRSLGGLLAAYDWSNDEAFLIKAQDLGERLFKAFDTESGLPWGAVNFQTGKGSNQGWTGSNAILAEFGTVQLEFRYLSRAVGRKEYATKTERVFDILNDLSPSTGLFPYFFRNKGPTPKFANDKLSFGAMADSVYEYMLKIWLQGGKTEPLYRNMYDKAMQGMHDVLLQYSEPNKLAYVADRNEGKIDNKMDHLACFLGGTLALGAYTDPEGLDSPRARRDLKTGKQLAYTCYQMYARTKTGISPEYVQFKGINNDFVKPHDAPFYILRPETVETFYVLNQLTGDPIYREWGWEIFQSIERYCKTEIAYGSLRDVDDVDKPPENRMESFFLAETLKYLYLLFDPDSEVDILNKHVFNTEAHPIRIFPQIEKDEKAKAAEAAAAQRR